MTTAFFAEIAWPLTSIIWALLFYTVFRLNLAEKKLSLNLRIEPLNRKIEALESLVIGSKTSEERLDALEKELKKLQTKINLRD